ncbi:MAG TPA: PQQ-dependent sugar dehydrogenase [Vicinamibacterales bacterium]|nr:PQQ-dependent sugar dehydrogenase [Vicinamibacterales bacterium]
MTMRRLGAAALAAAGASLALAAVRAPLPACDPDNGGITLPDGFCALVVADNLGAARHLTVTPNGDIYVAIRNRREAPGGIVALRDRDGDGRADVRERFGDDGGTGIEVRGEYLYFARDTAVVRYRLPRGGGLVPADPPEMIVSGLPEQRAHAAKAIAFDGRGGLYVNVGAPSNACQPQDRKPGVPGQDPCPLLERHGGIWRFDAEKPGQTQADGRRFATGLRQMIAFEWHAGAGGLYLAQHGRDQLDTLWPERFTAEQNAELPSEELLLVTEGSDFGWPYCYHDWKQGRRVLAPEYGGDGRTVGRCDKYPPPLVAFPGHWAPNDLLLYTGTQFPARYRGGAFIAFHGSWNRAPLPQDGYKVVFVPFRGDKPEGRYETFADGFAGARPLKSPNDAAFRPMGLAQGPDGSLYISDSTKGRIWRVVAGGRAKTD